MEIAVLIPCYNEERTVGKVIRGFQREIPEAKIFVGDNNSSDSSRQVASESGATIIECLNPGKGNTVRKLLAEVNADIYVMVDGDDTYREEDVRKLIDPVKSGKYDMCIGNRLKKYHPGSFPALHVFGNKLIRYLTYKLHRVDIPDMLSGYRVMNRKLTDDLCLISGGFEIETEINIKSVWYGHKIGSVDTVYHPRPSGSDSKLQTFHDGYRILTTILTLLREYQPMTMGGILFVLMNVFAGLLVVFGFLRGSLFIFAAGLFFSLLGFLAVGVGLILNAINISHREIEERQRRKTV